MLCASFCLTLISASHVLEKLHLCMVYVMKISKGNDDFFHNSRMF